MSDDAKSAIVLLAAGESRRLGKPKQLVIFKEKTLLRRAAEAALAACENVFVVVGANENLMLPELAGLPVRVVKNENWQSGMASSIRAGVAAALTEIVDLQVVVLSVCDQPLLSAEVFQLLFSKKNRSGLGIVGSRYGDVLGVPVLFERRFFAELLDLSGDEGARKLLRAHLSELASIDFFGGAWDVDLPENLPR